MSSSTFWAAARRRFEAGLMGGRRVGEGGAGDGGEGVVMLEDEVVVRG